MSKEQHEPLADRQLAKIRNIRVISFLIVIGVIIIGLANFTDALDKIASFARKCKHSISRPKYITTPIRIHPDLKVTKVPRVGESGEIVLGFTVWAETSHPYDISMVTVSLPDTNQQELIYSGRIITDQQNQMVEFPLILSDSSRHSMLVHIPVLNPTNPQIDAKINFVPYGLGQKISAEVAIVRDSDGYRIRVYFSDKHFEFGSRSMKNGRHELKFVDPYKKPPEIWVERP